MAPTETETEIEFLQPAMSCADLKYKLLLFLVCEYSDSENTAFEVNAAKSNISFYTAHVNPPRSNIMQVYIYVSCDYSK